MLYSVDAAFSTIVGLIILATRNMKSAPAIDGALLSVSMLMLSPMTSQSHYVAIILPPFVVAAV